MADKGIDSAFILKQYACNSHCLQNYDLQMNTVRMHKIKTEEIISSLVTQHLSALYFPWSGYKISLVGCRFQKVRTNFVKITSASRQVNVTSIFHHNIFSNYVED